MYETTSLYVSAALYTLGKAPVGVTRGTNGRAVFRWADADGVVAELAARYKTGRFPHIQPRDFVNAIFYMRDLTAAAQ